MSDSATADSAYFHTLNARPYSFPANEPRDIRLADVVSRLYELPTEIRCKIFEHAFSGNRVAVTAKSGCYCFSENTGPYRADHQWLLNHVPPGQVRREAQCAFIRIAMWEVHCRQAMDSLVGRMAALHSLCEVRHVRLNVFELEANWKLYLGMLLNLKTVTFGPWQKGWTIDIPAQPDSEQLSDENVMLKVWRVLESKAGYAPVLEAFEQKCSRRYQMYFVFPIRFYFPSDKEKVELVWPSKRWQLSIWRACLDAGKVERDWREVHLVQEATLD